MNRSKKLILPLLLSGSLSFPFLNSQAQKLPKIQEGSVYAPATIKIDGKLDEWGGQLKAYNTNNLMFYTVSNDDKNLYLTIKMKGGWGSRKAFRGGIGFTISPTTNTADNITVTYPAMFNVGPPVSWDSPVGLLTSTPSEERYKRLYSDTIANKKEIDDLVSSSNKTVKEVYKDIQVIGINGKKGDSDELISVYNEEGIKLAGVFNRQMEYIYEVAIPLKYLGDRINKGDKFSYNIKLNVGGTVLRKGYASFGAPRIIMPPGTPPNPEMDYFNNSTDFSGEYTLAKK